MTRSHAELARSSALKRLVDVVLSLSALFLLSPLLLGAAIAIRLAMGSPVLYRHVRPGLRGEPFELVKFRSMTDAVDCDGRAVPTHQRITRLGRFMRKTSIDELPQLWNVLRGEMSLVGPRPLLMEYLPLYDAEQLRRHEVLPGVTGWTQVSGRRSIPMAARLDLDVWYVDNWSLLLDLRIIVETAKQAVRGTHAEPEVHLPAPDLSWAQEERQAVSVEGEQERNSSPVE